MNEKTKLQTKNVVYIPITDVEEIKGEIEFGGKVFKENVRKNYGDLKTLAKQIQENGGIRQPCKGLEIDGKIYLTDGHRRYRAANLLLKDTGEVIDIPMILENEITEEKRLIDMIICNDGLSLNPVEQADAVQRLFDEGMSEKTIMDKTGFSNVYICNLKMLHKAPEKIKDLIINNNISATLAMSIMRKEKDFDKAIQSIEEAIAYKQETSNTSKITERDLRKAKKKVNSFSAIRKAYKHWGKHERVVRQDKIDLFAFISRVMEGDVSYDELMAELFEPKIEEPKKPRGRKRKVQEEA